MLNEVNRNKLIVRGCKQKCKLMRKLCTTRYAKYIDDQN